MFKSKRGAFYFLIDVLLVFFILFITITTILSFRSSKPSLLGIDQQLEAVTYEFFNVEIRDYSSPIMSELRLPGGAIYDNAWNLQMTLDELIVVLKLAGYDQNASNLVLEAVETLPNKYGFNYSINGTPPLVVYSRPAIVDAAKSKVKLTRRKITWPRGNLTVTYLPSVTEVSVWQ